MRWLALVAGGALLVYPFWIYWGSRWLEPRVLGLALVAVWTLRMIWLMRHPLKRALALGGLVACALLFWFSNSERLLLLTPALINVGLALGFAWGLYHPPTLPARMARRYHGYLTPEIEKYTNQITCLWIGFFCVNAGISVFTVLSNDREHWLLYNGLISYFLIGALAAGEYAYRHLVFFKKHKP
jgi:uncharacterized membrane protein